MDAEIEATPRRPGRRAADPAVVTTAGILAMVAISCAVLLSDADDARRRAASPVVASMTDVIR